MEYQRITKSYKSKFNSISVSPYSKNISLTYNSSLSNKKNYNNINKITSSINDSEENDIEYKYELLLKEKNTLIQKLQNHIKKLTNKEDEKNKKIKIQKHMIESLKESNKNLQEELVKKNLIIQQNQNIEKKIFHLQKEYLEESNNSFGNNFLYIQSLKEQMNKLNEKEEEINNYKRRINILKLKLKDKEIELNKNKKLLKQYLAYFKNKSGSVYNSQNKSNYEMINSTSPQKSKSMKNYSTNISNNNIKLKEELKQNNIKTNKSSIKSQPKNNYNNLIENYKIVKAKCNYYYKLAHHLKSKNNKLNKEISILRKDINLLNYSNVNLKKLMKKQRQSLDTIKNSKMKDYNDLLLLQKNDNGNNEELIFDEIDKKAYKKIIINKKKNLNNIKTKSSIELISEDEKDKNENIDNNHEINKNSLINDNKAAKKLYEALEHYRELYNQKEKECNMIKISLEEKEKTIESLNSLQNQITEYLTIIDELETTNKNNNEIIKNLSDIKIKNEEKIKELEKKINEEKNKNETLNKRINKLNIEVKEKENKIKKLLEDLKDKEILIKEEQINSLIKINNSELKKEDFPKKINELQTFISNMKKELDENKKEINKLSEEKQFLKRKSEDLETNLNKISKEKNDEIEEKNIQLEELVKKLNEQEIQCKGVKYDNQELVQNAKERIKDMKQKEYKINQLQTNVENLKHDNRDLLNNIQLFTEEKNKLISKYNILMKELNDKKENIEYLQSALIKKTEFIDKIQKSNDNLTIELNNSKIELKQKNIELNQLEFQYNKLKQEKNISDEMIYLIDENNKIIIENKNLRSKLEQLTKESDAYNNQIKVINKKYQEQKNLVQEKEEELKNMKEASKAILEKHKKMVEEKNPKIDPSSWILITSKKYNKLIWYLLQKKQEQKNNYNYINNNDLYNKFIWVNGNTLTKVNLTKFNKFEDDEQKIKDLQEFNYNLQKKLERKEESINILDYKNKKLMEQLQNKTFANPGNKLKFNLGKNIPLNTGNNNGSMGERGFESEKFKNILQQLNNSNLRETKLQKEVKRLKEKLKKKEEFEAGFPKNFKYIEPLGNDSGFLDDDLREQEKKCIIDLIKSNTDDRDKLSTKKSDTNYNENGEDNKKLKDEITNLKNKNKDLEIKYKNLEDMVKVLIKNIKYESNIKPYIDQICQLLGYSSQTT